VGGIKDGIYVKVNTVSSVTKKDDDAERIQVQVSKKQFYYNIILVIAIL
jgi:hypothetical protein